MKSVFWLSDEQFSLIEPHLPYRAAGKRRKDDRRIATRYDKNAENFLAALCLTALICYWIWMSLDPSLGN